MFSKKLYITFLVSLFFCYENVYADKPLQPPGDVYANSPNGKCSAYSDPRTNRIEVGSITHQTSNDIVKTLLHPLWTMPGWARDMYLSNDCHFLVIIYDGKNLLRMNDRKLETIVFYIVKDGKEIKQVTLGEIYKNLDVLIETQSHFLWYEDIKWDGEKLEITTVDKRNITIGL